MTFKVIGSVVRIISFETTLYLFNANLKLQIKVQPNESLCLSVDLVSDKQCLPIFCEGENDFFSLKGNITSSQILTNPARFVKYRVPKIGPFSMVRVEKGEKRFESIHRQNLLPILNLDKNHCVSLFFTTKKYSLIIFSIFSS